MLRLVQWRLKLAEYEDEIVYKAGKINANAEALSRKLTPVLSLKISEKPIPKSHYPVVNSCVRDFRKAAP